MVSSTPQKGEGETEDIPLPNKTYTIPSTGHTYVYIYHPAQHINIEGTSNKKHPTLLWLHGFPSTSAEWRNQVPYFLNLGYGILAPDLLGYGGSSKPLDVDAYVGKAMAAEIVAILENEGVYEEGGGEVVGIGHDWGTYLLSRLATFYPERFSALVFMSVGFHRPGVKGNIHAVNEKTKRRLGYEQAGYQVWFASEEAGRVLGENWETFFNLIYPTNPQTWTTSFAPLGSLKRFLLTNTHSSTSHILAPWISPQAKDHHHKNFTVEPGSISGYEAPLMWYKRGIQSTGWEDEKRALDVGEIRRDLRDLGGGKGRVLMVGGLRDTVCSAETARMVMRGVVDEGKLRCVDVDAGHWIMLERPGKTNEILRRFLEGEMGGGVGSRL
ncbi:hypothetical protein ONS95_009597 [Cadophora gregata]|uniref:uncharacterized protein n=1 Tax=Cadophora gregata TaxID=51156 RepID=UPI0026DCFE62|nr:uncharacterized protein ONS95_009597 [Cadophora gregata]KAK0124651.1 hypothetical protein ONS95_009597 [Cadophora gregata]KAK0129489.1 hypothetical protein ONS96_000058 [Cadophora gregata f. sp. sojae]